MTGYRQGKPSWCDEGIYPVVERLGQTISPGTPLFVNVGGGMGHDLAELMKKHSELTGIMVL